MGSTGLERAIPVPNPASTLFKPVKSRRSFEDVIEQIADAIRAGDLRPGDRLPSERVLASRMEISRPTLREAIRILVDTGVVAVRLGAAGGVFVVSDIVPRGVVEQRSRLRLSEVGQVLEARRMFEPAVAHLAAAHAQEQDFLAMADVIDLHEASSDRVRIGQFDLRFHLAIARATHNGLVVSMMKLLQRDLEIVRDMAKADPFNHRWTITIHAATLDAIRSRDSKRIDEVMEEHLSYLETIWQEETGLKLRFGQLFEPFRVDKMTP